MSVKDVVEAWKGMPVEELLRSEYIDKDKSIPEIAKELHLSVGTIYNWITSYGLHKFNKPWTSKLTKGEIKEILNMKGE